MNISKSPLARPETYRRLIKPHPFSYVNDICSILVEERERMEHELFSSGSAPDTNLRGLILAIERLYQVENRVSKYINSLNSNSSSEEE